jgi:plastocyanin
MAWRGVIGLIVIVGLGTAVVSGVAGASGGGACPAPLTNGPAQGAEIKNYCYEPTVVYIAPGEVVRWVNRDGVAHTVTGANRAWGGYRSLRRGGSVAYRFNTAGVYPFYCVLHVGMVGAVVAEHERGRVDPAGRATPLDAVTRVSARTSGVTLARARALPAPGSFWQTLEIPALGGAVALAAVGIHRRRRSRS